MTETLIRPTVYLREHPVIQDMFDPPDDLDYAHTDKTKRVVKIEPMFAAAQQYVSKALGDDHTPWRSDSVTNVLVYESYIAVTERLFTGSLSNSPSLPRIINQYPIVDPKNEGVMRKVSELLKSHYSMRNEGRTDHVAHYGQLPQCVKMKKIFHPPVGFYEIIEKWTHQNYSKLSAKPLDQPGRLALEICKHAVRWVTCEVMSKASVNPTRETLLTILRVDDDPQIQAVSGTTITGIRRGNLEVIKQVMKSKEDCAFIENPDEVKQPADVINLLLERAIETGEIDVDAIT